MIFDRTYVTNTTSAMTTSKPSPSWSIMDRRRGSRRQKREDAPGLATGNTSRRKNRAKTREDAKLLHAWIGKKRPSTNSPIEAKTPRMTRILRANSCQANKGPKQHPRGARVGLVNCRSGIPRPPNNSLYELYPLVGVEENEIIPDTMDRTSFV